MQPEPECYKRTLWPKNGTVHLFGVKLYGEGSIPPYHTMHDKSVTKSSLFSKNYLDFSCRLTQTRAYNVYIP